MSKFNPTAMSYAYLRRAELPSQEGEFYRDAGLSKEQFEAARTAQTPERKSPEPSKVRQEDSGRKARNFNHVLPDPRPDFAPPNRRLFDEEWERWKRDERSREQPAQSQIRGHIRGR